MQQDAEFGAMPIDDTPQRSRAEYVTPTPDCFPASDNGTLEQQFFDIEQAQLKAKYRRTAWLMTAAGNRWL